MKEVHVILEGPIAQSRGARLRHIEAFIQRIESLYPEKLVAAASYGSIARVQDGPYSDIELFCVVDTPGMDTTLEWVYGNGKAEINLYGEDVALRRASEVSTDWALSHGQFAYASLITGDASVIENLRTMSLQVSDDEITNVIVEATVGELYEWIGKLRNLSAIGAYSAVPVFACKFAEMAAMILGLAHRRSFTTGTRVFEESLQLPDLPRGYAQLCNLVTSGRLYEPDQVLAAVETAWAGMIEWQVNRGIDIRQREWPE